jgi:uncharacterized membrane-anchored protein
MNTTTPRAADPSKVPEVTLGFWIVKILATTLGETGGDAVTMSLFHADKDAHNGGYLLGAGIFMALFVAAVAVQIAMTRFHSLVYWATIVATTTVGTAMADFADRSLGVGYAGGSAILLALLIASLMIWRLSEGTASVNSVTTPRSEVCYWATILLSQTLGTALGDWAADTNGLGFDGASLVFGAALATLAAAYAFTNASRVLLFWAAFTMTRPLGATLGDLLDKPVASGGFRLQPRGGERAPRRGDRRPGWDLAAAAWDASRLAIRGAGGMTYDGLSRVCQFQRSAAFWGSPPVPDRSAKAGQGRGRSVAERLSMSQREDSDHSPNGGNGRDCVEKLACPDDSLVIHFSQ